MSTINAADIKRRGVSAIAAVLEDEEEAFISVRGKECYVVMTVEKYNRHREAELVQAVQEARADYAAGRVSDRRVKDHMQRLDDEV